VLEPAEIERFLDLVQRLPELTADEVARSRSSPPPACSPRRPRRGCSDAVRHRPPRSGALRERLAARGAACARPRLRSTRCRARLIERKGFEGSTSPAPCSRPIWACPTSASRPSPRWPGAGSRSPG
jgi:hypothetical protein